MNNVAIAVADLGGVAAAARLIGVTSGAVSQWVGGSRAVPPDRCPAIERATCGRMTCEQLRADVRWVRVPDVDWPHPLGRPCLDVAAPPVTPAQQEVV